MVILASTDIHRDCFFSHFMCVYYSVIECLSYDNSKHVERQRASKFVLSPFTNAIVGIQSDRMNKFVKKSTHKACMKDT